MRDSYAERIQRWVTLCANAEPLIGQLPAAQELHAGLKTITTDLVSMADRIQNLQGEAFTLAKQRQVLAAKGAEDANRLRAYLQGNLGLRNPELVKFGIRPQVKRNRTSLAKAKAKAEAGNKAPEGKSVNAEA